MQSIVLVLFGAIPMDRRAVFVRLFLLLFATFSVNVNVSVSVNVNAQRGRKGACQILLHQATDQGGPSFGRCGIPLGGNRFSHGTTTSSSGTTTSTSTTKQVLPQYLAGQSAEDPQALVVLAARMLGQERPNRL